MILSLVLQALFTSFTLDAAIAAVRIKPGASPAAPMQVMAGSGGAVASRPPANQVAGETSPVGDSLRLGPSDTLTWNDDGIPGPFRIYRGYRKPGTPWQYNHTLIGGPIAGTTGTDPVSPLLGNIFYYLITREGPDGESIPGRDGDGTAIPNVD